jgi:hypothetical protein
VSRRSLRRRQRLLEVFERYPTTQWYGLDLARVARLGFGELYVHLAALERDEWVFSKFDDRWSPPRRIYWLNRSRVDHEVTQ